MAWQPLNIKQEARAVLKDEEDSCKLGALTLMMVKAY